MSSSFSPGSLVRARGREWVVLPDSSPELLLLQPLGGAGGEVTGLFAPNRLETVEAATFAPPDPQLVGDARASRMLREAVRLGFRSGAGPFRSFGRIAVEPRPYQLVPLLLALQLDPVRLLIADDVGVGKTVEAGLIAREMLDRGEITRLAVLCPPHLAQQWVEELREKFHLEAQPVLSSTARRLEAPCGPGESLFDFHPITVVSLDYIKTESHRNDFIAHCPEMVIVDEAHSCAQATGGARQLRHHLLQRLATDSKRHLILVSATPHSGNADAFRSLLTLLKPEFATYPDDLSGAHNAEKRRALARHLVQRRRADIEHYMDANTPFPKREEAELGYELSSDYKKLFDRVLAYARESVADTSGSKVRQRVRWWAALGLLRALASSPKAAAATLEARARNADAVDAGQADTIGRRGVLDLDDDAEEAADMVIGARIADDDETGADSQNSRRLRALADEAMRLAGAGDHKLEGITKKTRELLDEGFSPIIFCRFIETANYVAEHLRTKLRGVEVEAVTGLVPPAQREEAIEKLATDTGEGKRRVLVATDCLSEGINLQAYFNAVVHYDLPWNPTRLEQREGRVDRFGQTRSTVRALLIYGKDNAIDGIILDVLLRKHRKIRKALGVSVPVPANTDAVVEAIFEGLLLRGQNVSSDQMSLFEDIVEARELNSDWDSEVEREKRSRTVFAHEGIRAEDVAREVEAMRRALGGATEVEAFVRDGLDALGVGVTSSAPAIITLGELPAPISDPLQTSLPAAVLKRGELRARFDTANAMGESLVGRTHPLVASLAAYTLESALDPRAATSGGTPIAARCGAMRTASVIKRTTLLLLRLRFQIHERAKGAASERDLLAEDCALVGFRGAPDAPQWLSDEETEALLNAIPSGNIAPDQASDFVARVVENRALLDAHLETVARARADELSQAHRRVRDATKSGGSVRVEPTLPLDLLGIWVFVPELVG